MKTSRRGFLKAGLAGALALLIPTGLLAAAKRLGCRLNGHALLAKASMDNECTLTISDIRCKRCGEQPQSFGISQATLGDRHISVDGKLAPADTSVELQCAEKGWALFFKGQDNRWGNSVSLEANKETR